MAIGGEHPATQAKARVYTWTMMQYAGCKASLYKTSVSAACTVI